MTKIPLRRILWPLGLLYGTITWLRNKAFDLGAFRQTIFDFPVIAVGNLNTGGTGKTPHVELVIRLLQDHFRPGMISRGYGRKTRGFYLVDPSEGGAREYGDEPLQVALRFPNVPVAVGEDRELAIPMLLSEYPELQVIVLDDAFQHRRVKAGVYILLTCFDDLYTDDAILPAGNLREWAGGSRRAQAVIVTKCPAGMTAAQQQHITARLSLLPGQQLYFSQLLPQNLRHISTLQQQHEWPEIRLEDAGTYEALLFAGIAGFERLAEQYEPFFKCITIKREFPDHHLYTEGQVKKLMEQFSSIAHSKKMILTTEKDAVRLAGMPVFGELAALPVYYVPVAAQVTNEQGLQKQLLDFVRHTQPVE